MSDFKIELKRRLFRFSVDCGHVCNYFLEKRKYNAYCNQLIKSAASVGANYRAACRAKSDRDFMNKLKIVEEECDESLSWRKMLKEFTTEKNEEISKLHKEGNEILSITVASIKTTRKRLSIQ